MGRPRLTINGKVYVMKIIIDFTLDGCLGRERFSGRNLCFQGPN